MRIQIIIILLAIMLGSCAPATTPAPTEMPIPILALALTVTPLSTATVFPTQPVSPTTEHFDFSMLSPDGTKKIQSRDWVTFDILDLRSSKVLWSFSYDRAKFGKSDSYLPEAGYVPFYWSQNGKYIYMYAGQGWDGGVKYFGDMFGADEGLEKFDLDAGVMTEILPERYGGGYTFAISPDEKGVIYIDQRETPLVLRWKNLITGDETALFTFDEKIYDVGDYEWSPEMDKIIFIGLEVQNPGYTDGSQKFFYNFFVMDLKKHQPHIIIERFNKWLEFESWNSQSQVSYKDWDGVLWRLDLDSKTLIPIGTATPSP